eukprot:gene22546-29196_t
MFRLVHKGMGRMVMTTTRTYRSHHYRLLCTFNNISDQELQESFEGFWPKVFSLQVLSSDAGQKTFLHLDGKCLLGPLPYSLYTFAILQDPLLKKYAFNPTEFAIGAEEAFKQFSLAIASREFLNFANGFIKSSAVANFVQNTVSENLYNICVDALNKNKMDSPETTMESIDVSAVHYLALETRLIRNNLADIDIDTTETATAVTSGKRKKVFPYPVDSVVAKITMVLQATENYRTRYNPTEDDAGYAGGESTVSHSRVNITQCTFEGCISGHAPLDWKIISIG